MNDCIFCRIVSRTSPAQIIYEDDDVMAFLDITPDTPGHAQVIPKKHYDDLLQAPPEVVAQVSKVVKKIAPAIMRATNAEGFNLGVNTGEAAGQIIKHMHMHIIPRTHGDGLVMWEGKSYAEGEFENYGEKIRIEIANL